MPLEKVRGFSLSGRVLNDQDKLLSILTWERGIIKAVAPGAMKKGSRFGAMLELFTEADFFFYEKEGKELVTLSRGDIHKSYFEIVARPSNIFYFYFIDEVIERFLPAGFMAERVCKLLNSILESSRKGVPMPGLLLYFLIWIVRIEGLMFGYRSCQNCGEQITENGWIKENQSGVVCKKCMKPGMTPLPQEAISFIKWTESNPPEVLSESNISGFTRMLLLIMKNKMEYHGELSFNSSRYLSEFS